MGDIEFSWRIPTFPVNGEPSEKMFEETIENLKRVHSEFDGAWMDDHFHPWLESMPDTTPVLECWTALTYLSAIFTNLEYSAVVLCNSYRSPAYLAKASATFSVLTGGRFVLGIGAGWKEDEYRAYGYPFPSARERIGQLDEAVRIIKKMWSESPASFEGRYYTVKDAYCLPSPTSMPPIMIGGGGERLTLEVVARHADWWNLPGASPSTFERKSKVLEEHCSRLGRDPREIRKTLTSVVAIAESTREAEAIAAGNPLHADGEQDGGVFVGSPDVVREHIQKFVEIGVTHFNLRFLDFPSSKGAELFAKKVAPSFRKRKERAVQER